MAWVKHALVLTVKEMGRTQGGSRVRRVMGTSGRYVTTRLRTLLLVFVKVYLDSRISFPRRQPIDTGSLPVRIHLGNGQHGLLGTRRSPSYKPHLYLIP